MVLQDTDVIQVDAIVIVGVLVLLHLTFSNLFGPPRIEGGVYKTLFILITVMPFAASAIVIGLGNLLDMIDTFFRWALGLMISGFVYLIISLVVLLLMLLRFRTTTTK
jgi:hypothetical protein